MKRREFIGTTLTTMSAVLFPFDTVNAYTKKRIAIKYNTENIFYHFYNKIIHTPADWVDSDAGDTVYARSLEQFKAIPNVTLKEVTDYIRSLIELYEKTGKDSPILMVRAEGSNFEPGVFSTPDQIRDFHAFPKVSALIASDKKGMFNSSQGFDYVRQYAWEMIRQRDRFNSNMKQIGENTWK